MDNKTLLSQVAKRTGRPTDDVAAIVDSLASVIKERCGQCDTIAIPRFGNFIGTKEDEKIVNDLSSGKRVLLPPQITLNFQPSAKLRNSVKQARK